MISYIYLAVSIVSTVIGQICLKKGMLKAGPIPISLMEKSFFVLNLMVFNQYIVAGLILAIITTISWMLTLSKLQLSSAYPFMSLAFPLVIILSTYFFGETISLLKYVGIILIMIGLIIISKY
jgi:drug/metabolite transporter (DMT)-like permease